MSQQPSDSFLIILRKLNRTCDNYARNFSELEKVKEQVLKLEKSQLGTEAENLDSIVQFMKTAKSDELAIKLVYLSFIRDLEVFKRRQPIENPEGDYLT